MSFFGRAKEFVGRMAGPSYGQRMSQVNQNKINNFARTKINAMDTRDIFKGLNKNTQLKVMTILKRLPKKLYTYNDLRDALPAARFSGSVNQSMARKAAAAAGYAAQRGAVGLAAPIGLTAATIGNLGYTGYQGGLAAAAAASKKYGNVKNIVTGKYNQLSGRKTNQNVAKLNANVKTLEARVSLLESRNMMMAKARLNNYKN